MNITENHITLNRLIFESSDILEFEKVLEELIEELNLDSISNKNKLTTIYYWLFISKNINACTASDKGKFLNKYNKYLCEIYDRRLNITKKIDKYQAEALVVEFPMRIINDFEKIINNFNNIKDFSFFESKIKQLLFSEDTKSILRSFIESELMEKHIVDEIFRLAKNYKDSDELGRKDAFYSVKEKTHIYIEKANKHDTYFCQKLITPFAEKLINLIKIDFSKTVESDPAEIKIIPTEKKYPFYKRDFNINVEIEIINAKEGTAYNFQLNITYNSDSVTIQKTAFFLGNIEKGKVKIELKLNNRSKNKIVNIKGDCLWNDLDDTKRDQQFNINFICQKDNVDWTKLEKNRPYNLEPISSAEKLIGRIDILNALNANIQSNNIESYIIHGQKRTGKTSIVKTFETIINNLNSDNRTKVSYIDGGDIAYPEVIDVISNLGIKICEFIKHNFKQVAHIEIPTFNDALAPIDSFLNLVVSILPDLKIMYIIDEFDEFTFDLYKGKYADSFFQTIRSISSKPNFGFILVGGEKMEIIKKHQGYRLNKFKLESITYFDKENNYTNFTKLIRKPISDSLEITDEGIALIYEYTSGNPYFTKLICIKIVDIMLRRRDSSITVNEVTEGIQYTLNTIGSNSFHHFWMDGVLNEETSKEDRFEDRRKLLLSFAESLRFGTPTKNNIIEIGESSYYLKRIISEDLLLEFLSRDVFIRDSAEIHCKVKLFEKWLVDKGINEIITSSSCTDSILKEKLINEQDYVNSKKIVDLVKTWGTYKGKSISEDSVRSWLNQFGDNANQKLAFNILKAVKFYDSNLIREKLNTAFSIVLRGLKKFEKERIVIKGHSTRKDLLVSYLDEPAKSGAYYAKQFADENKIFHQNVIEKNKIFDRINKSAEDTNGLIFIDDFIGTGKSITENLNELLINEDLVKLINDKEIIVFIIAISGFTESKELILKRFSAINNFEISICDPLSACDKVFHEDSPHFDSPAERLKTRDLISKFGEKLEKGHPLGFYDSQAIIVFEQSCPNNTLPVLWKDKKTWFPLFKR